MNIAGDWSPTLVIIWNDIHTALKDAAYFKKNKNCLTYEKKPDNAFRECQQFHAVYNAGTTLKFVINRKELKAVPTQSYKIRLIAELD